MSVCVWMVGEGGESVRMGRQKMRKTEGEMETAEGDILEDGQNYCRSVTEQGETGSLETAGADPGM